MKYHFQDNAIYIGGDVRNKSFETAATYLEGINKGLRYTLRVSSDASGITLTDNSDKTGATRVTTDDPAFYNRMTREYIFSDKTMEKGDAKNQCVIVRGSASGERTSCV